MRTSPRRSRGAAVGLLLLLATLAPISGCECTSTLPVVPNPLPPLSAVEVSPDTDTLRVGEQRQFTAVAYDTLGQPVSGAGFLWASGDPSVFTVTLSGRVKSQAERDQAIALARGIDGVTEVKDALQVIPE